MALDLTEFGYLGPLLDDRIKTTAGAVGTLAVFSLNPGYGGIVAIGTALTAMNRIAAPSLGGDVICVDTTTDDSYTTLASANSKLVSGVYLGYIGAGGDVIYESLSATARLIDTLAGTRIIFLVD